mmetsp:Transcript_39105/g.59646  ORF Transcript_39105/g.59646 Transcript_39105/m.59646 type:complete len:279 (-) Transcript_39105:631-1467(-)
MGLYPFLLLRCWLLLLLETAATSLAVAEVLDSLGLHSLNHVLGLSLLLFDGELVASVINIDSFLGLDRPEHPVVHGFVAARVHHWLAKGFLMVIHEFLELGSLSEGIVPCALGGHVHGVVLCEIDGNRKRLLQGRESSLLLILVSCCRVPVEVVQTKHVFVRVDVRIEEAVALRSFVLRRVSLEVIRELSTLVQNLSDRTEVLGNSCGDVDVLDFFFDALDIRLRVSPLHHRQDFLGSLELLLLLLQPQHVLPVGMRARPNPPHLSRGCTLASNTGIT